ncbi:MAG: hypothetical protein HQP61_07105 [Peptococcaceae bacterium]|nr:hypothetical protein [Candidatus Syntrophopropionicum ammoniitolerans]
MVEEKVDGNNTEQQVPMEEHPFYKNRPLKIFMLLLTIAVFVLPVVIIINIIMGKRAFFFF